MIGCLVLAFALCQTGYGYGYGGGYVAQSQVVYAQPQVYYQPAPVYYAQPVYVAQPQYYGGGYGYQNPFGGISVAVGPRGGVRIGVR